MTAPACPRCDAPIVVDEAAFAVCANSHWTDRTYRSLAQPAAEPIIDRIPPHRSHLPDLQSVHPTPIYTALPAPAARTAERAVLPLAHHWERGSGGEGRIPELTPDLHPVSAFRRAAVEWLWPGRIPIAKLTVLDGDPGLAKSLLTLALAARLSTGRPMPHAEEASAPAATVLLNAEDDISDTIRPRLEAAGADLDRVHTVDAVLADGRDPRPLVLPDDIAILDEAVQRTTARLLVIDPIMAFLAPTVATSRDQAVRHALLPLARLAARRRCAVLVVRHLNKSVGLSALYRGGGSIGIIGAARSGLLVGPDPLDPTRRLLAPVKTNLAARPDTLAYSLAGDPPALDWHGPVDTTADVLLGSLPLSSQGKGPAGGVAPALSEAIDWLREQLAGGPRPAAGLIAAAQEAGITRDALYRARKAIAARATRAGFGARARSTWSLPEAAAAGPPSTPSLSMGAGGRGWGPEGAALEGHPEEDSHA